MNPDRIILWSVFETLWGESTCCLFIPQGRNSLSSSTVLWLPCSKFEVENSPQAKPANFLVFTSFSPMGIILISWLRPEWIQMAWKVHPSPSSLSDALALKIWQDAWWSCLMVLNVRAIAAPIHALNFKVQAAWSFSAQTGTGQDSLHLFFL